MTFKDNVFIFISRRRVIKISRLCGSPLCLCTLIYSEYNRFTRINLHRVVAGHHSKEKYSIFYIIR